MSYRYLLGLGSNDNAEHRLPVMVEALLEQFGEVCLSPVCRTSAEDGVSPDYLNAVASVESQLLPPVFNKLCKAIEVRLGRVRSSRICAADIDILACWERPEPTRARDFIQEPYFQPQADSVLECLGLNSEGGPFGTTGMVSLRLGDGREVGQDTVLLKTA